MMFKEALDWEAKEVFCNPEEFAEAAPVILNGVPCSAQVIGLHSELREAGDGRNGVVFDMAVIHIASGQIPLPRADREIDWNGEKWVVSAAHDNKGIYRIAVYRERS